MVFSASWGSGSTDASDASEFSRSGSVVSGWPALSSGSEAGTALSAEAALAAELPEFPQPEIKDNRAATAMIIASHLFFIICSSLVNFYIS